MPGLRYQAAAATAATFSTYTTSPCYSSDMHIPAAHRAGGGLSWDRETLSPFQRPQGAAPCVPSSRQKAHRPPQWLQKDLTSNFLSTKHWGAPAATAAVAPVCHGSNDSDDLQAMVHDFIENDPVDYMDGVESDEPALKLTENLQMLTTPYGALERELLTDVKLLLLTINEDTDLICDPEGPNGCKGGCAKRFVVKHLKIAGYSAAVCKSTWLSSGCVPGGEYEYIDVVFEGEQQESRLIVDVDFQAQFEIARPSPQYEAALKMLPTVFVGATAKLEQVLELMSEAAKASLKQSNMHLPPWRTLDYMSAKWFSKFERKSSPPAAAAAGAPPPFRSRPCSLHWRAGDKKVPAPSTTAPTEVKQCGDQLRRTKVSLIAEVKGSGLGNLPRGRSSRANLLLRTVL